LGVIPGRAKREPGIHSSTGSVGEWIPRLRLAAHPGMTRMDEEKKKETP